VTTFCRTCKAEIEMVRTTRHRWTPVDVEPNPKGNMLVDGNTAVVLTGEQLDAARERGDSLRISHFATCPDAAVHRRR
jgi:hypothetical protein